jgi:hypothetical protein
VKRQLTFSGFRSRLLEFIFRHSQTRTQRASPSATATADFNDLALDLFSLQFDHIPTYRRFCKAREKTPATVMEWLEIPALPVSSFKEFDISSLAEGQRPFVFHSSGTTSKQRSRHFHNAESLELYEASLTTWFQRHFLPDLGEPLAGTSPNDAIKLPFVILTPCPALAPHSSLVHMFETVRRQFGSTTSLFTGKVDAEGAWTLDLDATTNALDRSIRAHRPVAVLGTAFSFIHLFDHLERSSLSYGLAPGSRVLETGGYKGRSRVLPKSELHQLITRFLGVPDTGIICEYGMSELSSQAYDRIMSRENLQGLDANQRHEPMEIPLNRPPGTFSPTEREAWDEGVRFMGSHSSRSPSAAPSVERIFQLPPWARMQVISPETRREVAEGETGLIRVFDLANIHSVLAIQTEDLGIRRGDGFELIGRAAVAEPRGCSLMTT